MLLSIEFLCCACCPALLLGSHVSNNVSLQEQACCMTCLLHCVLHSLSITPLQAAT